MPFAKISVNLEINISKKEIEYLLNQLKINQVKKIVTFPEYFDEKKLSLKETIEKKPFSQKGTGNARQGSSKPPNFRGGATSMGPVVRNHSFDINKKEKKLALRSALSSKMNDKKIIFIDNLKLENHKTNDLNKKLKKFNFDSALFIYDRLQNES